MTKTPTLNKRHFQFIADIIRGLPEDVPLTRSLLTRHFANHLRTTNPQFRRHTFLEACGEGGADELQASVREAERKASLQGTARSPIIMPGPWEPGPGSEYNPDDPNPGSGDGGDYGPYPDLDPGPFYHPAEEPARTPTGTAREVLETVGAILLVGGLLYALLVLGALLGGGGH